MKKVAIIGGGFAGLWAAISAVRTARLHEVDSNVEITLINKDQYHGLRPRYYEKDLSKARINLESFLIPLAVKLLMVEVNRIDHHTQEIFSNAQEPYYYDRLILATGSHLSIPDIPGLKQHAFNVDSYAAADTLKKHIERLPEKKDDGRYTIIVAGGGFTGIEVATNLIGRLENIAQNNKARVIIIDRSKVANRFSQEAQAVILTAFKDMKIESVSNAQIKKIGKDSVELDSGETIATQTVVWTAGMKSNKLTQEFDLDLDPYGRLPVDRFLRIQGVKHCFAAGDVSAATTDGKHSALQSCQHAMPQGRFAGNNVIADLFGKELAMYEQTKYVTCLDLGSWGALYSEGWDQRVVEIREAAKKIKLFINHDRIYPPSVELGVESLLAAAEPAFTPVEVLK